MTKISPLRGVIFFKFSPEIWGKNFSFPRFQADFRFSPDFRQIFPRFQADFRFSPDFRQIFFPNLFQKSVQKISPTKMWVLVSSGGKIVGEPTKSESAMAKRLGLSRQFLNRQLKKGKNGFIFQGKAVLVKRQMEFSAAGRQFETQNQMADALGLSRSAVARVFKTETTGVVQTKEGKKSKDFTNCGFHFYPCLPQASSYNSCQVRSWRASRIFFHCRSLERIEN